MKKNPPPPAVTPSPVPPASPTPQGEGGGRKKRQSTIKLLRPDQVWHPKIGAPYGNQNALKPINALRRRIRDFQRRARAAIKAVP